jgi:hypothetical protein
MPDVKPPRLATDERETLLAMLRFQRESLVRKATGVPADAGVASPVGSGTSLRWLVAHLAEAELLWVGHRFAGGPRPAVSVGSLDEAIEAYGAAWPQVDAVIASASLEDTCRIPDQGVAPNLRWVLTHLLAETARHAGHADILRELIDGSTGR